MRWVTLLVFATSLLMAADSSEQGKSEPNHYLKIELDGQQAKVEIRGRLHYLINSFRGNDLTLAVGDVANFVLVSQDKDSLKPRAQRLNRRTVVVTGTVSLAATQRRNYDRGTFLGRPVIVDVQSIEAAEK